MAELVVCSTMDYIESLINEGSIKAGVGSKAKAVQSELGSIMNFLIETQLEEIPNNEQVCSSLAAIKQLAYNAEDAVDAYVFETSARTIRRGILKKYWISPTVVELDRLRKEMEEVQKKLHQLKKKSTSVLGVRRSESSKIRGSQDDNNIVIGIKYDLERMLEILTRKNEKNRLDVVAIVGMGGSGKTTFARNIYNHPDIQREFRYHAWISISRGCTASEVVSEISKKVRSRTSLLEKISRWFYLFGESREKCLIVLDNVWDWEPLIDLLPKLIQNDHDVNAYGFKQTKIVITSRRHPEPSGFPLKYCLHEMQFLSIENGWELFNKIYKKDQGQDLPLKYHDLANQLIEKCKGLPLAIVELGMLLKTKSSVEEWERVTSQLVRQEGQNDIYLAVGDILALSYKDLRYYLKPCFLYLGLFPEDYTIKAETVMKMWIAEGIVWRGHWDGETSEGEPVDTLESRARWLLQKLIDHTMVQVTNRTYSGKVKKLQVHDIMRTLCIKEARALDLFTVCSSNSCQNNMTSRRAAIDLSKCSTLPLENTSLRSLILHEHGDSKKATTVKTQATFNISQVFEKFKLLRVLDVNGIKTYDGIMPKEIGNLIHLRYLRIRSTNIHRLPKSIGKLVKLLTLDYWNVVIDNNNGIGLPNELWRLTNLRHLYLPCEMNNMPEDLKMHGMKDLQTLWGVRGGTWMLKEMPKLSSNLKKLFIQGISSYKQMESAFNCPVISTHDHLYSLSLEWYGFCLNSMEALCWKKNLKKLKLKGNAPDDRSHLVFPSNLVKLELYYTQLKNQESMEALGKLQCLKFLRLAKGSYIGSKWIVKENAFPQLEGLKLSDLQKFENWEMEKGALPCLRKLKIVSCTSLQQLPQGLMFISTLQRLNIERMPAQFNRKLRQTNGEGGEDSNIIQGIPTFQIKYSSVPWC